MFSLYQIKPAFQQLLRPVVKKLAGIGVTANQVTCLTTAVSVLLGMSLWYWADSYLFVMLPIWLFLRMALNAIDGMLAREHGQSTVLGAYLNELADVISDAFLYLPFAWVAPFNGLLIASVIWLAAVSELAGVLGAVHGASRHYEGPMGKSDRALLFGILSLWFTFMGQLPAWMFWVMLGAAVLIVVNIINRVRAGLQEQS